MMRMSPTTRWLLHAANALLILFLLFPIAAVLFAALQSEKILSQFPQAIIPPEITFDNFALILSRGDQSGETYLLENYLPQTLKEFYRGLANSIIIAVTVTLASVGIGAMSAYSVARTKYRWVTALMQLNMIARFVPILVLMIPLYTILRGYGLLNSLHGVILAEIGFLVPFATIILTPYFESMPQTLEDAARIDGLTRFSTFVRIVIPLATPGLSACGAIIFIISWHELLVPFILNSKPSFMTLPVIIASMVGDMQVFFGLIMATALIAMLPTIAIVLLLRKYVVQGLSEGALKG